MLNLEFYPRLLPLRDQRNHMRQSKSSCDSEQSIASLVQDEVTEEIL